MWTLLYHHMKTANVRDVRNRFSRLAALVENGEKIEIRKRGKPIAWLVPIPKTSAKLIKPDFAARRKALWGARVFSPAEIQTMRDMELAGEQG
jgi:antitoxin (DNA-binding transcriptional repressor) of toxin-antitoxin stability system